MSTARNQGNLSSGALDTPISEQERKVIEPIRQVGFGEVRIVLKDSEIVQIEEKKSIKL